MGDGRTPYESAGAGKFRKRLFGPETYEDPQNDPPSAEPNKSTGASEVCTHQGGNLGSISVTVGKSELEQLLKQMTFTGSESQRLIALVHSRTIEESPSTRVLEEAIAPPAELALKQDMKLINNFATALLKAPVASPQHPATMENLPEDLLSNIFIRLFAKQLAQMRSVSKSWKGLLSRSSFIKSHLHRSVQNNDQILLAFYHYHEFLSDFKPCTAFPCLSPHLELTNFIKLPVNPRPEHTNDITVIGSVNGLICSCYGDSVIHIWNPSLSAVSTLPPYSMPFAGYDSIQNYFRFGFDPNTNDYKVVKLMGFSGPSATNIKWWLQVEVFSMRTGLWESISERFPSHITDIIDGDYVCVDGRDGHLHWLGCIGEKMDLKTIVAFDLGSETFREMPFPDSIPHHNRSNELGVLSGKLCVTSQLGAYGVTEVWVMEEYGVAESWVKRHVFPHFIGFSYALGFTSHNEVAIENDGSLVLYDPVANKQKVLGDCCPDEYGVHKIVEYVDSLVWVAHGEHEILLGPG